MSSLFKRILVPLGATSDQPRLLRPATVYSSWFEVPVQLITQDGDEVPRLQVLAGSLGVAIEPVLDLEGGDGVYDGLAAHAHGHAPSLIVADGVGDGPAIAAAVDQPVLLVPEEQRPRIAVGPFVVEITGQRSDLDALALATVLAQAVGVAVRLVVADGDDERSGRADEAATRVRQMDCEVGIDRIDASHDDGSPLIAVGRTRGAGGLVIPADRIDEPDLVAVAAAQGVPVFVAPASQTEAGRAAPFGTDLTRDLNRTMAGSPSEPPPGARLAVLDREECLAILKRHSIARIGYVEDGWPVVLPINYRLEQGDVFIRSLAGGKVRAAKRGEPVCLELDGYDESLRTGWSVMVHGELEVITDSAVLNQAWANDPNPWVASESWSWLRLIPVSISGREVAPSVV